jgi:hypothetical protein
MRQMHKLSPNISKLEVEVQASDKSPLTFGSLIGESTESDLNQTRKARSINEFIDEKKERRVNTYMKTFSEVIDAAIKKTAI